MCPTFALTLPCLKNGNGQRDQTHAARSQAIMLKYFSVSVIAFSAAVPYNRKENGVQAANSEAKGTQRHAVLAANFLHRSVNVINSNLQQSNVYPCDCVWSCSTNHAEKAYGSCRDTFCGSFAASGEGPVGDAGFRGIEIPEEYARPERNVHYREIPMKITTSRPLRKYWTPYAELQRRKADGRQGLQGQRRASRACGMG